ncbi:MAG: hypothetical protein HC923_06685, partial [Myxococcales bacterium]|nr:hypothetical protein [Myxococcales bacterium]
MTLECRLRRNDGIGVDGYVETAWESGTVFATAQAVCASDNADVSTAITALPADAKRSMDVVPFGARGCFLWSTNGLVAALGVEDLVVVATGDAVLVCPRDRS